MVTVTASPQASPRRVGSSARARSGIRLARLLVWPALITAIVITQVPFLVTIYYSFREWNLLRPGQQRFVGFDNYANVLGSGVFLSSLWATVLIVGV
ncbi:sugar ABC transporter permease, partial [Pseudactinotalea sp. HY160]|nr:sugar ABC transporter permease [Pseudactinotalea sp. HY160]